MAIVEVVPQKPTAADDSAMSLNLSRMRRLIERKPHARAENNDVVDLPFPSKFASSDLGELLLGPIPVTTAERQA